MKLLSVFVEITCKERSTCEMDVKVVSYFIETERQGEGFGGR